MQYTVPKHEPYRVGTTCKFWMRGAVLGAVADESHCPIFLPITAIHHVHVQPRHACTQWVVRSITVVALNLGPHPLPAVQYVGYGA